MPVVKKRNQQTESRLLLESDDPVELPPAEVDDSAVVLQFEQFRQYVPELLEKLREGTEVTPVPVTMDGSTFVVHGETRSFWVKLWHSSAEMTRVERVQIISCLPSTRGLQLLMEDPEDDDYDEADDLDDEDDYADEDDIGEDEDDDEDAPEEEEDEDAPAAPRA